MSGSEQTPHPEPWDHGLQNERTALAWTRTGLALLATGLIMVRVMGSTAPVLATALAVTSVVLAGWTLTAATRRYRRAGRRLASAAPLPDGQLPALITVLTTGIGGAGLVFIILD
jgi:uncharacterized membrane protein YidH (DUF202 family)